MAVPHAHAQTQPALVVSPMQGTTNQQAAQAIVTEFEKTNQVFVLDPDKVQGFISQYSQEKKPQSSQEALEFFNQGKTSYQNLEMEAAVDYFRKAERLYKNTLWDEDSFRAYRTTKFQLAQSFLALGRKEEARVQMEEVMLLDPGRQDKKLSEKFYSPQVRALYQSVYEDFLTRDKGSIVVESDPGGAQVYMDGTLMGQTPGTVPNVPVGKHYFRFVKDGFEEKMVEQFVVKGANRIQMKLTSNQQGSRSVYFETIDKKESMDASRVSFLDEMGVTLGVDIYVFLSPEQGKVSGQLFDQRTQEMSPVIQAANPQALVQGLMQFLGQDGYVIEKSIRGLQSPPEVKASANTTNVQVQKPEAPVLNEKTKITKQWWFWPAVGVVVIGTGAGLYFGGVFDAGSSSSTLTTEFP